MIPGNIIHILARQVPNYHLVAQRIARSSLSVCACRNCKYGVLGDDKLFDGKLVCTRVFQLFIDKGYALVAENGTCDRAEFRKDDGTDIVLRNDEK